MEQLKHYEKAKKVLPGGVNSSTRFNKAIGAPFYVKSGRGSKVTGIDGKEYTDMCCFKSLQIIANVHND